MIDMGAITKAVKDLLDVNLSGYTILRNAMRNLDPNNAAFQLNIHSGWINVTRGKIDYRAHTTGSTPWLATVETRVEIQVASMASAEEAEDRLQDAEQAVLNVLTANKTLSGTVLMTMGYSIAYEFNDQKQIWHHAAIITIKSEVRA